MWIIDFPLPYYGQGQAHRDAWPELRRVYREMTGKPPPDAYTEEAYKTLFDAVERHVPAPAAKRVGKWGHPQPGGDEGR